MNVAYAELLDELRGLRRGRGVEDGRLRSRLGPQLRELAHITTADSDDEAREKLVGRLIQLSDELEPLYCSAVRAALNLDPDTQEPLLKDRIEQIARQTSRDPRTIRRRVDEGIGYLADVAVKNQRVTSIHDSNSRWRSIKLQCIVLDQPVAEDIENAEVAEVIDIREIEAEAELTELRLGMSVNRDAPTEVEVLFGGILEYRGKVGSDRHDLVLVLPAPLQRGQRHRFALRVRATFKMPYFVFMPRRSCEEFDLVIRFGLTPAAISLVREAFQADILDPEVQGEPLAANDAGEVHAHFRNLTPGFAYGVRWVRPDNGALPDVPVRGIQLH